MADYVLQSTWEDVDAAAQAVANGLQKSQLSQSVQTSLDHADSAYQSHFWVNITRSNNVYSSDKTLSEIQAAYAAGKYVRANLPDGFQSDFTNNDSGAMFYAFDDSGGSMVLMRYTVGASSVVFQSWPVGQQDSFTEEFKTVLLDIAAHVAWDDANGQSRYDALEAALYPEVHLVSITADYEQDRPILDTDSLDLVRLDLVVTANYSDGTTETLADDAYTLTGTLTVGTSTITVGYGGKTAEISVVVTHDTVARIAVSGKIITHFTSSPYYRQTDCEHGGITIMYPMAQATNVLYPAGIIPTDNINTLTSNISNYRYKASLVVYDDNGNEVNFVSELDTTFNRWVQNAAGTMTEYSQSWTLSAPYSQVAICVDVRYLDDAYMYDKTTGNIWFAGKNTPYWKMSNISELGG